MSTTTIRLYEHPDTSAREEGTDREVVAHGWDYRAGDTIQIDGRTHVLTCVYGSIQTGDPRGNYVLADAAVRS